MKSSDIHLRAISREISQPSIIEISLNSISLKYHSNLPGANELSKQKKNHLNIALLSDLLGYKINISSRFSTQRASNAVRMFIVFPPHVMMLAVLSSFPIPGHNGWQWGWSKRLTKWSLHASITYSLWYLQCWLIGDIIPWFTQLLSSKTTRLWLGAKQM